VFYTNSNSRKGKELAEQAHAAMVMHWAPLERQVRVEGRVEMLSSAETDEYFHSCVRTVHLDTKRLWPLPNRLCHRTGCCLTPFFIALFPHHAGGRVARK